MNFQALLALFNRSVRDDARSKTLLWARAGVAVTVLFAILRVRVVFSMGGAPGLAFFSSVVWMNFVFICVAGVSYFASSITEEKEEGTLGLLRMTDLSPVAILLGKGTSRLVGGLLLLLVQVPFAMLAVTLGGVRLDQVLGSYGVLAAFLFFACNAGLLGSVLSARSSVAAVGTALIAVAYCCWPFLAVQIPSSFQTAIAKLVPVFCPPALLDGILGNRGGPVSASGAVLALLGGGCGAFAIAWLIFDRFCSEDSAGLFARSSLGPRPKVVQAIFRPAPSRAWSDAICWRDYYFLHGGTRLAIGKALAYLAGATWLGVSILGPGRTYQTMYYFSTLLTLSLCVVVLESLFATSRIYRLERKEKTLSSLMLLPQYYDGMLKSKQRAIWISLVPGLCFVGISALVLVGPLLSELSGPQFVWVVQGIGYLVAQLYFNHNLVAWFSLRMKWGGFPLALGISWVANMFAGFVAILLFQMASPLVLIIATTAAAFSIRNAFRRRLAQVAAEE
jgi:ABC-type transport system involved in cytochrome c biogenesis permease component